MYFPWIYLNFILRTWANFRIHRGLRPKHSKVMSRWKFPGISLCAIIPTLQIDFPTQVPGTLKCLPLQKKLSFFWNNVSNSIETEQNKTKRGFLDGSVVKNLPANVGNRASIPGQEDPTIRGATKPVRNNKRWACALEPRIHNKGNASIEKAVHKNWTITPSLYN